MVFAGTTVSNGTAVGVVTQTGMNTEIGRISEDVTEAAKDEEKTPLGQKIDAMPEAEKMQDETGKFDKYFSRGEERGRSHLRRNVTLK